MLLLKIFKNVKSYFFCPLKYFSITLALNFSLDPALLQLLLALNFMFLQIVGPHHRLAVPALLPVARQMHRPDVPNHAVNLDQFLAVIERTGYRLRVNTSHVMIQIILRGKRSLASLVTAPERLFLHLSETPDQMILQIRGRHFFAAIAAGFFVGPVNKSDVVGHQTGLEKLVAALARAFDGRRVNFLNVIISIPFAAKSGTTSLHQTAVIFFPGSYTLGPVIPKTGNQNLLSAIFADFFQLLVHGFFVPRQVRGFYELSATDVGTIDVRAVGAGHVGRSGDFRDERGLAVVVRAVIDSEAVAGAAGDVVLRILVRHQFAAIFAEEFPILESRFLLGRGTVVGLLERWAETLYADVPHCRFPQSLREKKHKITRKSLDKLT